MSDVDDYLPRYGAPVGPWYNYFAWKPVKTVDRGYRWLCLVKKRRIQKYHYIDGPDMFWFQYVVRPFWRG